MRKMVAFVALSVLAAMPAMADPETGSRLSKNTRPGPQLTPQDANLAAQKMANCLVSKRTDRVAAALLARGQKAADAAMAKVLGDVSCINLGPPANEMSDTRQISFSTDVLRGKLAEALLREDKASIAALTANPLQKQYIRPWFGVTTRHSYIDEMATCVVDTNPAGVGAVFTTATDSPNEATAIKALVPNMVKCLRAGASLNANKQALRAALAEAMWQRLHAPAVEQVNPPGTPSS